MRDAMLKQIEERAMGTVSGISDDAARMAFLATAAEDVRVLVAEVRRWKVIARMLVDDATNNNMNADLLRTVRATLEEGA